MFCLHQILTSEQSHCLNSVQVQAMALFNFTNWKLRLDNYLKLTDACQTNANNKKNTGIIGKISTIGSNGAYASGNFAINKATDSTKFLQY